MYYILNLTEKTAFFTCIACTLVSASLVFPVVVTRLLINHFSLLYDVVQVVYVGQCLPVFFAQFVNIVVRFPYQYVALDAVCCGQCFEMRPDGFFKHFGV